VDSWLTVDAWIHIRGLLFFLDFKPYYCAFAALLLMARVRGTTRGQGGQSSARYFVHACILVPTRSLGTHGAAAGYLAAVCCTRHRPADLSSELKNQHEGISVRAGENVSVDPTFCCCFCDESA
jgi:hypothetical protein